MPKGAGDESVFGQPARGREHKVEAAFPAARLKAGNNRVNILTVSGSWVLYDAVDLFVLGGEKRPESLRLFGLQASALLRRGEGERGRLGWVQCDYWGRPVEAEVTITCGAESLTQRLPPLPLGSSRQSVSLPPSDGTAPTTVRVVAGTNESCV